VEPVAEGEKTLEAVRQGVTPHLVIKGAAEAIAFYVEAFGAEELARLEGQDGKIVHAQIRVAGSTVMLAEEMPQWGSLGPLSLGGTPVSLHLAVADADAAFERAVAAGAKPLMPPQDMFWGDRYGRLTDPFGHNWSVAHRVEDVSLDEMKRRMATMFPCK
jgi:uncharacterized glyoxalase superfamily protein PhnB